MAIHLPTLIPALPNAEEISAAMQLLLVFVFGAIAAACYIQYCRHPPNGAVRAMTKAIEKEGILRNRVKELEDEKLRTLMRIERLERLTNRLSQELLGD